MNGVGGDNVWLIYDGRHGELLGLNAVGRSAAGVDADRYRTRYGANMPTRGGAAALTVPGAVSGWWEAHRFSRDKLGSPISWKTLLDDAIARGRDGIPASTGQRRVTEQATALFTDDAADEIKKTFWPVFHPDRLAAAPLTQRDLARTLELVAQGGAKAFYTGDLAGRIAHAAAAAGSPLCATDFAEHRAEWVEPLRLRYRDGEAASLPPPTQGFAALAILALLEGFELGGLAEDDYVHLIVEATRLVFEDRDRYLADPAVVRVPVDRCLDPDRLARRRQRISRRTAMPAGAASAEGDTVAVVTADEHGNAASLIQSLYHEFGSAVIAGIRASCFRTAARPSPWIRRTRTVSRPASAPGTRSSRRCISSAGAPALSPARWAVMDSRRPRRRWSLASSIAASGRRRRSKRRAGSMAGRGASPRRRYDWKDGSRRAWPNRSRAGATTSASWTRGVS